MDLYRATLDFIVEDYRGILASIIAAVILAFVTWVWSWTSNAFRTRKYGFLAGNFFIYAFDSGLKGEIVTSRLKVRKRWGHLRAYEDDFQWKYKGRPRIIDRNLFILMSGKGHEEQLLYVFGVPYQKSIKKLWGVRSCTSVEARPCAARCLLVSEQLTPDEVQAEFQQEYGPDQTHVLIAEHKSIYEDNLGDGDGSGSVLKWINPGIRRKTPGDDAGQAVG